MFTKIYIHSSISSNIEINITWPPKDIKFFDPIEIPLLNSFILVSSGFTVTLSHYYLIINYLKLRKSYLSLTILLGIYFIYIFILYIIIYYIFTLYIFL